MFKYLEEAISKTFEVSRSVPPRKLTGVLAHMISELGELATEIAIVEGDSYKKPDSDGIFGESIDIINCVLDLIFLKFNGDLNSPEYLAKTLNENEILTVPNYQSLGIITNSVGIISNSIIFTSSGFTKASFDIIVNCFALIKNNYPKLSDEDILIKFEAKLAKWKEKANSRVTIKNQ